MINSLDKNRAEIILRGPITEISDAQDLAPSDRVIDLRKFERDLAAINSAQNVTIKINSDGGDVDTAKAIYNALIALPARKVVQIEGIAASAASVIAMAGDEIQVYPDSVIMIHGVRTMIPGFCNMQELDEIQKMVDVEERALAAIYAEKTGLDVKTIRNLMLKETWMVGQEAIDAGFADTMIQRVNPLAIETNRVERAVMINGINFDLREYQHCPFLREEGENVKKFINEAGGLVTEKKHAECETEEMKNEAVPEDEEALEDDEKASAEYTAEKDPAENDPTDEEAVTVDMLAEAYPDLVEQIRQTAIEEERQRIAEIEEIENSVDDEELVQEAKYGKQAMTAAMVALAAAKKHNSKAAKGARAAYLKNLTRDRVMSGASKIRSSGAVNINKKDEIVKNATAFMAEQVKKGR